VFLFVFVFVYGYLVADYEPAIGYQHGSRRALPGQTLPIEILSYVATNNAPHPIKLKQVLEM
jgi:hypothetical protein